MSTFSADEHLRATSEGDGSPGDGWLCRPRTTTADRDARVDRQPRAVNGVPNGGNGVVVQPALPMPFRRGEDGAAGMQRSNGNKPETATQRG